MIKRMPLWLKMGLSFVFLMYVSTALAGFMVMYLNFGSNLNFFDILIGSLLAPLIFPLRFAPILFLVPLCAFVIGAVIGLIYENFFIKIKEKFNFPMIKRIPLWLKMGLSFAFLTYVPIVLAFFMIGLPKGFTFFKLLIVSLLPSYPGSGIIFIKVLLCAFVIGAIIGIIRKFFYHKHKRKKK